MRCWPILPFFAAIAACAPSNVDESTGAVGGKADDLRECEGDDPCLEFQSYEVLFTNPLCATYEYDEPIERVRGGETIAKPKNVYCSDQDSPASGDRQTSPRFRILEWLEDVGEGDEVFLSYLSFSDPAVAQALCAAEERGAEVTFVLDKKSSRAEEVEACGGEILIRGHQGSVGFAHTKLLMINPQEAGPADEDPAIVRMSFGSGNMSTGTHLHHENWHFLRVPRASYFVEAHLCLIDALTVEETTDGKTPFRTFMNTCRDAIGFEEEMDIRSFFIPVREDSRELTDLLTDKIGQATSIDIGAHRFSYRAMTEALSDRLADLNRPFHLRLEADDDLYWLQPLEPSTPQEVGPNSPGDLAKLNDLRVADDGEGRFEERYLETNHSQHQLHHNKYVIFHGLPTQQTELIVGSSNLTGTGFNDNLENMYWTNIPEVVDAFERQFELFWTGEGPLPEGHQVPPIATAPEDMPVELVRPTSDE